jgi:hypothetical protein
LIKNQRLLKLNTENQNTDGVESLSQMHWVLLLFQKKVRNTLIQGLFADFDLKNAQPEIIRNICNANNIPCPNIEQYCNNRNEILNLVMTSYDVDKGNAKKLFLRLCFFGTFKGWSKELNIDKTILPFIADFQNELICIANKIKIANPMLFETARKLKESKQEKNYIGSMCGLVPNRIQVPYTGT